MENRFLSLHTLFLDKDLKETNLRSKHVVLKEKNFNSCNETINCFVTNRH